MTGVRSRRQIKENAFGLRTRSAGNNPIDDISFGDKT